MDIERRQPNIENRESDEEILAQVVPEQADGRGLYPKVEGTAPIRPFEVAKSAEPEVHHNIPNHPLKRILSEREKIDEANKILSGKVLMKGGPAEAVEFLQDNIDLPPGTLDDNLN